MGIFGLATIRIVDVDLRYDSVTELNLISTIGKRRVGSIREDQAGQLSLSWVGVLPFKIDENMRAIVNNRKSFQCKL